MFIGLQMSTYELGYHISYLKFVFIIIKNEYIWAWVAHFLPKNTHATFYNPWNREHSPSAKKREWEITQEYFGRGENGLFIP